MNYEEPDNYSATREEIAHKSGWASIQDQYFLNEDSGRWEKRQEL